MSFSDSGLVKRDVSEPQGSERVVRNKLDAHCRARSGMSCPQLFLKIKPFLRDISSSQSGQQLIEFPPRAPVLETGEEEVKNVEQGHLLPGFD